VGTLGGGDSIANAFNNAGRVVGQSETTAGEEHAFITGPNGVGMTDLGKGTASAINDAGQVVGRSETEAGGRAFITGPNGAGMTNLGVSAPSAINNAGQVVGESYTGADSFHAFITGPNGVGATDLGSLGGALTYSSAYDINDIGQVVGISNRSYCDEVMGVCDYRAFITGPNGVGMIDLGGGAASGINDAGQVVGVFYTAAGERHAFITGPNGEGITDLNSLVEWPAGIVLREAVDINNAGQVLVTALIPEPQSYALMIAGLILLGLVARRKSLPA
jgi:probable HAF family extracellular repeat protein